jgi:hypothetical protein
MQTDRTVGRGFDRQLIEIPEHAPLEDACADLGSGVPEAARSTKTNRSCPTMPSRRSRPACTRTGAASMATPHRSGWVKDVALVIAKFLKPDPNCRHLTQVRRDRSLLHGGVDKNEGRAECRRPPQSHAMYQHLRGRFPRPSHGPRTTPHGSRGAANDGQRGSWVSTVAHPRHK